MIPFKNSGKKATYMKTVGDAMNFIKWLVDFIQTIFGFFTKKEDEETPAD